MSEEKSYMSLQSPQSVSVTDVDVKISTEQKGFAYTNNENTRKIRMGECECE